MSTKALFPCGGGLILILGTGTENQIFILRTLATINFFHQILKNCHFGVKKKSLPIQMACMTNIWFPTVFHQGIIIFARSTYKIPFFDEISISGKSC